MTYIDVRIEDDMTQILSASRTYFWSHFTFMSVRKGALVLSLILFGGGGDQRINVFPIVIPF